LTEHSHIEFVALDLLRDLQHCHGPPTLPCVRPASLRLVAVSRQLTHFLNRRSVQNTPRER